ncbi:ribonuclease D [Aliiglaciecola sp. CAU 1673]|uniref:ribonuclease D n=1 Tax=Aliiglaciecola sp. CAU 1673 TaxID=3032595 RepID=UPI0023DC6B26|nr:ribonuclease D [Aliiglaciecola sp. CAU 1673]MDF2179832.1 ribonuclease D [Aliiglaciecola sp. CAU 1673]
MNYQYIKDKDALVTYCQRAQTKPFIAVDTEFVRTRTLTPQIGLVQLYDGEQLALVDPIAIRELSALANLLSNPKVIKVLHSCSEDLDTFWTALGVMPNPLFDTQFATSLLNQGTSVGYAKLVEQRLGVSLDKGESRTDWLARPLSEQQLAYAANDVYYLYQLFSPIAAEIEALGRTAWVLEESAQLAARKRQDLPSEYAYLTIKNNWLLSGRGLACLKALAAWRLEKARTRNLALNFVIKEGALVNIARRQPANKNALYAIPEMAPQDVRRHGEELLDILDNVNRLPPEHYPANVERLVDFPAYKKTSANLRHYCEEVASQLAIPVELLGSKKQINQLLKWLWFTLDESKLMGQVPELISGWRLPLLRDGICRITGVKFD